MPEERHGSGLLSASEKAIYDYLDEMLSDPGEGSGKPASSITDNAPEPARPTVRQSASPRLNSVARAVATATPSPQPRPSPGPQPEVLAFREKPEPKVLSSPESLLGFRQPVVVQQPAVTEKPALKTAEPVKPPVVETRTAEETAAPPVEAKALPVEAKAPPETIAPPEAVEPETEPAREADADTEAGDERLPATSVWCDNGRPDWAQGRFECLLFEVSGLKLAVPLVTLGAVHQIDRKFNELPGQYDWFIGILQTNLGNIKVIDTALCVMPERYDPASRAELEYVITLHGFSWGISCHKLLRSITLEPEDVKWRSQRGKRPWMAGTVVEQMCALIDPAGFHEVIRAAENRKK
ncbi:MAG: chemotaxis protein CheW [Ketobacteraceae bacterium]|nr:chemotaxis protein CheW [Ketobacteraceae bacterium]